MEFIPLYQELQNSTEMIRALLAGVTPEEARLKPGAEAWSILEVLCHLYDVEREDFREHLDCILHRQHEKWHEIDPQSWITTRKYNEQNFAEMEGKFFVEREKIPALAQWISESRLAENLCNGISYVQCRGDVRLLGRT